MCGSSSVGVTQDGGRSPASVASTAAHELGHIFNMGHDGRNVQHLDLAIVKSGNCCMYVYTIIQIQLEGVLVLMVNKDASWQPFCHLLHQLGGAAVVSRISMMDSLIL